MTKGFSFKIWKDRRKWKYKENCFADLISLHLFYIENIQKEDIQPNQPNQCKFTEIEINVGAMTEVH